MNPLHLIWFIPLAVCFGFILVALLGANNKLKGDYKMGVLYVQDENGNLIETTTPNLANPNICPYKGLIDGYSIDDVVITVNEEID